MLHGWVFMGFSPLMRFRFTIKVWVRHAVAVVCCIVLFLPVTFEVTEGCVFLTSNFQYFFTMNRPENSFSISLRYTTILVVFLSITSVNICFGHGKAPPSLYQRFWEIGCEFSGVVSRVRRSAPNPQPEEPNFEDPEELFNYLYPLADVKYDEEGNVGSQRSAHGTHSISSWLEDLMELWHSECNQRRMKRSAERRQEYNNRASRESWSSQSHLIRGRVDRNRLNSETTKRNSSLGSLSQALSSRRGDNYEGNDVSNEYMLQHGAAEESEAYGDVYNYETNYNDEENYKGKYEEIGDKEKDKRIKKATTTTAGTSTTPAPTTAPTPAPSTDDIFFAQYGGDIEYFFPLLSFGIPFDGEITLLGFHGFRGLFPY